MIRSPQVVIDGLGHTHHPTLITDRLHVFADLAASIHGIVAAVVEEVTDIVLPEYFQNTLVIGVVHFGVGHFIAAGPQGRGGRVLQQRQLLRILQSHVEQTVVQHAFNAVFRAKYLSDHI